MGILDTNMPRDPLPSLLNRGAKKNAPSGLHDTELNVDDSP